MSNILYSSPLQILNPPGFVSGLDFKITIYIRIEVEITETQNETFISSESFSKEPFGLHVYM